MDIEINLDDFLGHTVEEDGAKLMQEENVIPFGTALWP
jgi:hypothetical protein